MCSAKIQLQVPKILYAGEATNISCTGSKQDFKHVPRVIMSLKLKDGCTKNSNEYKLEKLKYHFQKIFTITCKKGNHTIICLSNSILSKQDKEVHLQGS